MPRLLRITTVPISLHLLLQGQFSYMRSHDFDVIAVSANGDEVKHILKEGTKHVAIPLTRKITPIHDLKCLWWLVREIRRLRPDIVHTHTPKAGLIGMLAAWICNVPVRLHTVAGLPLMEATGFKRWVLKTAERVTYGCAHKVYPNSLGLKAYIDHHFRINNQKIKIIGKGSSNGIDTVRYTRSPELEMLAKEIRIKHKIGPQDFVYSFVGRIVRDKGIVELIRAFKEISDALAARGSNVFLLLVGAIEHDLDPLPQDIFEYATEDKGIIFVGFQDDIRPWIMASDAFVFPSYREGFPNVVMQASLLKVPCIVTDINGCNEIVDHNKTGIIVPPKNVEELTEAMKTILEDKGKRSMFGEAAREFVATNFKREVIWEALRKEYMDMLQNQTDTKTQSGILVQEGNSRKT